MGKGLLFIIGAMVVGAAFMTFSANDATVSTQRAQSAYQEKVIARDIAESGFNQTLSEVKRELMDVPQKRSGVAVDGGAFEAKVEANLYGDLDLDVDGHTGSSAADASAGHRIRANAVFASPFPSAVALSDDEVSVRGYGNYRIRGLDRRAASRASGAGFLDPVAAMRTDASHVGAVVQGLRGERVLGESNLDGSGGVSADGGFDRTFYEAVYQEALTKTDRYIGDELDADVKQSMLRSAASNSGPGNPKIIRAKGDLNITDGFDGYGLLIVEDGDLNVISNDFKWEGLILVRKQAVDTVDVSFHKKAQVYGSVAAYSVPDTGVPSEEVVVEDCAADFDIVGNETIVNEPFHLKVVVLGAAISYGGEYDMPVTMQVHVGDETIAPFGRYDKPVDGQNGNLNTDESLDLPWSNGNVNRDGPRVYTSEEVYPAGSAITIDARSWVKRRSRYNGRGMGHWNIYMEQDSRDPGNNQQLAVLENESSVPSVGGFGGQSSIEDFVTDYIDSETGRMTLEDSDAIYLFELGSTDPASSAFDMQDLVVLVTMTRANEGGSTAGSSSGCGSSTPAASRIEFTVANNSEINYSTEAIAKLGKRLDTIRQKTQVVVTCVEAASRLAGETYPDGTMDCAAITGARGVEEDEPIDNTDYTVYDHSDGTDD